ncbi:MAG TPA: acyltransferase family protein, partial [Rhodocyclaceae bacterium]|nr:acyltransferase family protein [Rhodocyclaceae bacterium]
MRFFVIDIFKAVAAQLIVLHHLVAYGPIADAVQIATPAVVSWLYEYGRMAVQVFLVVSGYLAARTFAAQSANNGSFLIAIGNRYLRLVLPFLVALVLSCLVAALVRPWFIDDSVPAAPGFLQALAHVFLLHGVLKFDSLSAGAWYVAIDFQLFVLYAILAWRGRPPVIAARWALVPVIIVTVISLFHFNRDASFDNWAVYFFGAYGLGALGFHISQSQRPRLGLSLLVLVTGMALWVEFRERIAVALAVTIALVVLRHLSINRHTYFARAANYFGLNSYALFLVHFPLCLLSNAVFAWLGFEGPVAG